MTVLKKAAKRKTVTKKALTAAEERKRLANEIMGKYAWIPYSSEDFIRDKRREIELEERA